MAFQYPVTCVYNAAGGYTAAHSVEQFEALLAEGWLAEKPSPTVEPAPELIADEPAANARKCGKCGETGHTARTCKAVA